MWVQVQPDLHIISRLARETQRPCLKKPPKTEKICPYPFCFPSSLSPITHPLVLFFISIYLTVYLSSIHPSPCLPTHQSNFLSAHWGLWNDETTLSTWSNYPLEIHFYLIFMSRPKYSKQFKSSCYAKSEISCQSPLEICHKDSGTTLTRSPSVVQNSTFLWLTPVT